MICLSNTPFLLLLGSLKDVIFFQKLIKFTR
jgi:hypothetical protein